MDIIAHLLLYCVEIKDKPREHHGLSEIMKLPTVTPEQQGVCRAISYILQTLSAERAFGAKMTSSIKVQLPTKWGQMDTAADFIICVGIYLLCFIPSHTI